MTGTIGVGDVAWMEFKCDWSGTMVKSMFM